MVVHTVHMTDRPPEARRNASAAPRRTSLYVVQEDERTAGVELQLEDSNSCCTQQSQCHDASSTDTNSSASVSVVSHNPDEFEVESEHEHEHEHDDDDNIEPEKDRIAREAREVRKALQHAPVPEDHQKPKPLHPRNTGRRSSWAYTSATSRSCASQLLLASATATSPRLVSPDSAAAGKARRHVRFGKVHIHVHPLTLGDNPGVSNGVPLQMEWKYTKEEAYDLRETPVKNEKVYAQKFTSSERYRIALRKGFSKSAIAKETKLVTKIQESRKKSQDDAPTEVETFLASRRPPRKAAVAPEVKKKRLWWYHGR